MLKKSIETGEAHRLGTQAAGVVVVGDPLNIFLNHLRKCQGQTRG